jgi:hypothetical protein
MNIADLRLELVDVRVAASIVKDQLDWYEAAIAANVTGKNAEERKNALVLALGSHDEYQGCYGKHRLLAVRQERLEAEIENARDARREYEWSIRLRLVEALERRGMTEEDMGVPF